MIVEPTMHMPGEPKICRCCGQTLPEPEPPYNLRGDRRAIFERVRRAGKNGVDRDTLLNHIYGARGDSPDNERNVLQVQINHINKNLAKYKKRITNPHTGRGAVAVYRLVDL